MLYDDRTEVIQRCATNCNTKLMKNTCMRTEGEWNVQLGSIQLEKKCRLYTIESCKSWSCVCVILESSQQCSLVRRVQVSKPFIKNFWLWFVLLFKCIVPLYHKLLLLWNTEEENKRSQEGTNGDMEN